MEEHEYRMDFIVEINNIEYKKSSKEKVIGGLLEVTIKEKTDLIIQP